MSNEKVLEIVSKLLERTEQNGCTPGEAAIAIAKAQQLLAKHNLTLDDINVQEIVEQEFNLGTKGTSSFQCILALELAKHFGVRVIRRTTYAAKFLVAIGEQEKVAAFKDIFIFAYNAFQYSWRKYHSKLDCSTKEKNSIRGTYANGFMDGITNELIKSESETALVISESSKLKEYMNNMNLTNANIHMRSAANAQAYFKGYQDGSYSKRNKSITD